MDNSITIFEKVIGAIDWKLLQKHCVLLNTDYKISSFFTNHHLATMIYFHIHEHDSLRDLTQCLNDTMSNIVPDVSLSSLSNHNNNRNYH